MYFVANDRVIDMAIAFLSSFRKYNPDIPLCLIPFRNDTGKLIRLKDVFRFSVFEDEAILNSCDDISLHFHNTVSGHYRKLACWEGSFDEFVYIDIDMLVLKNIDFIFPLIRKYDFLTSCSNMKSIEKWVWKETVYDTGQLNREQIQYAASTGFIASRKGALSIDFARDSLGKAVELAPHMELSCLDQPLINFLIVTSGKTYSSLYALLDTPDFPQNYIEFWAGNSRENFCRGIKQTRMVSYATFSSFTGLAPGNPGRRR